MFPENKVTRRAFLATGSAAGGALILGFFIRREYGPHHQQLKASGPNAWLRITPDDNIIVLVEIPEMGQGFWTVDMMMLVEELEVDISKIRVEQAFVIPDIYKN